MTTFEHAMLGINGVLATGLHRRYGWQLAAIAGVAAIGPDWDGLQIVISSRLFDQGHRVWGHNLLACSLLGLIIGGLDYRFDFVTRVGRWFTRALRIDIDEQRLINRDHRSRRGYMIWISVAILAALSQLPTDMVFSGTDELADWAIKPLWPFSDQSFVYPMVHWGDVGASVIFVAGMFLMLRWPTRVQRSACLTLLFVLSYVIVRGTIGS